MGWTTCELSYGSICLNSTFVFRIESNIDRLVPIWQILEKKFKEVLKKRYGIPGLLVKEKLISDYDLPKYFSIVRRLFLFENDIIFPFYKKMFAQVNHSTIPLTKIKLTLFFFSLKRVKPGATSFG